MSAILLIQLDIKMVLITCFGITFLQFQLYFDWFRITNEGSIPETCIFLYFNYLVSITAALSTLLSYEI